MTLEVVRLHLAQIEGFNDMPVHGFVIKHPKAGAILVDSGVGWGDERLIREWKVVNRHAADALAEHDLSPADVKIVINSHLHFDHCGQNAVFKQAPFYIQRSELERARRVGESIQWFDFAGARFELVDGDAAYTADIYSEGAAADLTHWPGQHADRDSWTRSLDRLHAMHPHTVHFCHDTRVIHT